jgi:hypothetical protein
MLRHVLKVEETYRVWEAQIQCRLHHFKLSNRPTKAFFKALSTKGATKCMKVLKIIKGCITNREDIEKEFVNHYKMVF